MVLGVQDTSVRIEEQLGPEIENNWYSSSGWVCSWAIVWSERAQEGAVSVVDQDAAVFILSIPRPSGNNPTSHA